jgi:hypothetical protein
MSLEHGAKSCHREGKLIKKPNIYRYMFHSIENTYFFINHAIHPTLA